jgi:hypothetical protein
MTATGCDRPAVQTPVDTERLIDLLADEPRYSIHVSGDPQNPKIFLLDTFKGKTWLYNETNSAGWFEIAIHNFPRTNTTATSAPQPHITR